MKVKVALLAIVNGDVYMSNPRASNNRLNEDSRARKNNKRLFDSQNNNRGGVNVGEGILDYFTGQYLEVEYTQQHSCNVGNAHCDTIIQYYCHRGVRDGSVTDTIPLDCGTDSKSDCSNYGMHEDYSYYLNCKSRERNKGLFTSNQKLKGQSALYTRQDRQGTRYGYECPEERDYFPYWAGSPWKDIAILSDYQSCEDIRKATRNYSGYCTASDETLRTLTENGDYLPLTYEACKIGYIGYPLRWVDDSRPDNFYCGKPLQSRDNHHGNNGPDGHSKFMWKIPDDFPVDTPCVLRIRYNISTADFPLDVDSSANGNNGPPIGDGVGLDYNHAEERGYEHKNDPKVRIFDFAPDVLLELNVQTDQYGRTFEDRSHVFKVKHANSGGPIIDLSIRGKRGNSAQVYPTMYASFVPQVISLTPESRLNIHWSGSRKNNMGNDGRGDDDSTSRPDDPKQMDFHGISHYSGDETTSCLVRQKDVSEVEISSGPSLLTTINSSCTLSDWQHGYNWVPVDSNIQLVSFSPIVVNEVNAAQPISLPNNNHEQLAIHLHDDNQYQLTIQEMTEKEFSTLYPLAFKTLHLPSDQFDQQYYRITPANVEISATVTITVNALLYVWSDIKQHWTLVRKMGSDKVNFTNTNSGLIVKSVHRDFNFLLSFSLVAAGFIILGGGSILYFWKQPQEWVGVKRSFNEYILRRPI